MMTDKIFPTYTSDDVYVTALFTREEYEEFKRKLGVTALPTHSEEEKERS